MQDSDLKFRFMFGTENWLHSFVFQHSENLGACHSKFSGESSSARRERKVDNSRIKTAKLENL